MMKFLFRMCKAILLRMSRSWQNKRCLMKDAEELQKAFKGAPEGSKILYSYKTNCIPGILKPLHEAGIGAEVISPYELWLAEQLGVPGDMILYNGVDKSDAS